MVSTASKRLNRAAVLDAAESLVDQSGWRELTMTALAAEVGIRVPSLYTHVDSADELLAAIQVRAHEQLSLRLQRAAMGRSGATAFSALARVLREFADDRPGLYDLAMARPFDADAVAQAAEPSRAALLAVIESFGVRAPSYGLLMNCLATLHGVIALDQVGLFGDTADVDAAYDRAVQMVIDLLERIGQRR